MIDEDELIANAENGDNEAQRALALLYELGLNWPQNLENHLHGG